MAATARLVVQMTPQEKVSLEQRAVHAGVTTSDYVRSRLQEDALIGEHRQEIEALVAAIEIHVPQALKNIDEVSGRIDRLMGTLDNLKEETP